jgi:hypothetical protein
MLALYVDNKIHSALNTDDKINQLQTIIHPEINFKRNSINLLIGRHGSGKTFNILKEIIKLSQLPDKGGYNDFIYVSDKTNDDTFNELIKLVKLRTRIINYADVLKFLPDYINAKNAYAQILEKNIADMTTDDTNAHICKALDMTPTEFGNDMKGTIILYDDAINIFKSTKMRPLENLLFQNRQPRITYFIALQDFFGISTKIKRNADSVYIFGGFNDKQGLSMMYSQLSPTILKIYIAGLSMPFTNHVDSFVQFWDKYVRLGKNDFIILDV